MPRQFIPIPEEELYEIFKTQCTGQAAWQWIGTAEVRKDISKVDFSFENFSCKKGHGGGPQGLMGPTTLSNNLTFIGCAAGGDWEYPVFFIVYHDGQKLRGYIPKDGNTWNAKTKQAKSANAIVSFNEEALRKDIEKRITIVRDREFLLSYHKKLIHGIIATTGYVESQSLSVWPVRHRTGFTSAKIAVDSLVKAIQEAFAERVKKIPACKKCGRGETRGVYLRDCFYELCYGTIDSTADYWQALESKGWRTEGCIDAGNYAIVNNLDARIGAIDENRTPEPYEGEVIKTIQVY